MTGVSKKHGFMEHTIGSEQADMGSLLGNFALSANRPGATGWFASASS
jgi:hypothetical protein